MTLQNKLYTLFEEPGKSRISFILNTIIYILIIVSIINLMLMTVPAFQKKYGDIFLLVRNIVMPIFIIEYILRMYASGALKKYRGVKGKLKYAITPYAIIDLLSILPYIMTYFVSFPNSAALRSLRLLRIFRLFRLKKYATFVQLMKQISSNIKEEIIVLLFYTSIILVILSFVVFQLEHDAQPDVFTSVFQTMWWAVATLTTVGYGDIYPITTAGKIVTSIIAIVGIAFVAIPGGMFASEFISAIGERKKKSREDGKKCPKCASEKLIRHNNPIVKYDDVEQKYNSIAECTECNFTWLK